MPPARGVDDVAAVMRELGGPSDGPPFRFFLTAGLVSFSRGMPTGDRRRVLPTDPRQQPQPQWRQQQPQQQQRYFQIGAVGMPSRMFF